MQVRLFRHYAFAAMLNVVAVASAMAGELPLPPAYPSDVPVDIWWRAPPARFSWTGCHLGAHIGAAFGEDKFSGQVTNPVPIPPAHITFQPPTPPPPPPPTPPPPPPPAEFFILNGASPAFPLLNKNNFASFGESGMLGGVQAGCDLQLTPTWVIGIDADASGPNVSGSTSVGQSGAFIVSGILPTSVGPVPVAVTTTANSAANLSVKTNFISTVTGRLGYSIERGKGLFYAKAGAALANNSYNFSGQVTVNSCNTFTVNGTTGVGSCTLFNPAFASLFNFSASETRVGWTVGGGIEWAILNDWSVKLEYDYLDFGSHNVPLNALGPNSTNVNINQRINEVKLGVNYLFGW